VKTLAQILFLSSLASPLSLTDHEILEIDLDVSFSQKIPVRFLPNETTLDHLTVFVAQTEDRNSTYRNIRRALRKVFMHSTGCDDRWQKYLESSDEETR
jgi:hypothetical protein